MTKQYSCELTYGWLSAEAKSESYNQANRDSYHETKTIFFLEMNPQIGKQFNQNENKEKENEVDDEENYITEPRVKQENQMLQMSRKSLGKALLNYEKNKSLRKPTA